jgi:hypothetical protein
MAGKWSILFHFSVQLPRVLLLAVYGICAVASQDHLVANYRRAA